MSTPKQAHSTARSFTPRAPLRTTLTGQRAIDTLAWNTVVQTSSPENFRASISSVTFEQLTITRLRHTAARVSRPEHLAGVLSLGATLLYVWKGRLDTTLSGVRSDVRQNECVLLSGTVAWSYDCSDVIDLIGLTFPPGALARHGLQEPTTHRTLPATPMLQGTVRLIETLTADFPRPGSIEGLTMQKATTDLAMGYLRRALADDDEGQMNGHAARAFAFIGANYLELSLSLEIVSEATSTPPRTLQRHLQRAGTTLERELTRLRVRHAASLLSDPAWHGLCLEEVAGASGFRNAEQMRRAFRAAYGLSPAEFRAGPPIESDATLTRLDRG